MNEQGVLTAAEDAIMRESFRATMMRAADIIDKITNNDVMEAQTILFASGVPLGKVAKIDRAMVASSYLRACAIGMAEDTKTRVQTLKDSASKL